MPDPDGAEGERHGAARAIRVSEISEYAYCSRAWWYRHVVKVPLPEGKSGRLAAGTRAHQRHGRWVATGARLGTAGAALFALGILALAVGVWILFSG
jgi:CRISPR/Cas system-associated exonuclease Cas4 (RecB family)